MAQRDCSKLAVSAGPHLDSERYGSGCYNAPGSAAPSSQTRASGSLQFVVLAGRMCAGDRLFSSLQSMRNGKAFRCPDEKAATVRSF